MSQATLTFTGDIGFDHYMQGRWNDPELLDSDVLDFLLDTDHLIVNVEGALSKQETGLSDSGVKSLIHSCDPDAVTFLSQIRADVWNICNNHIMDAGEKGMADTLCEASKAGVKTLGAGMNIDEASAPVIFDIAGGIGMIGVGYQRACRKADENTPGCFSWADMDLIRQRIQEIKKTCRWCIVVAHGGEEFTALPSPYTRDRYIEYLNLGADIVVSHHPHVPMNYETIGSKVIFYSLGNFVFDTKYQRSQFNTEKGLFIKLRFTEDKFEFEPFGIVIDRESEHIHSASLPMIFENVQEEDYKKLIPLSSKMFIENTKRQQIFLKPDKYNENTTAEEWYANFYEPLRSGRVPGECLDFQIIYPLSLEAQKGAWMESGLEKVKEYILEQLK